MGGRDFAGREDVPSRSSDNAFADAEWKPTGEPQDPPANVASEWSGTDVDPLELDARRGCECTFLHPTTGCPQQPTLLKNGGEYAICSKCNKRTCWACSITNVLSVNHTDKSRRHLQCPQVREL